MSSKIITSVLFFVIVVPFAYFATQDAVSIKQNLQEQHKQIQHLQSESAKLDKQISDKQQAKAKAQTEVKQLDQQTQDAAAQRQQLEAELGAN